VEEPDQVQAALEQALASNRPTVVEVVVDPYVPPMPPKVSWDQAKNLATSLIRGQPNRERIALTLFRDRVDEVFGKSDREVGRPRRKQ
jgi:pyruvate dehydrogenase (quinone)/pyruvate oxidase